MRVIVTGAGGLVGKALCPALSAAGHTVKRLVRGSAASHGEVAWDPAGGRLDPAALAGTDAAVHLAGESIAAGRWTAARKKRIRDSRVAGTSLLASTLAGLTPKPRVAVMASAIGYYGDGGDQVLREEHPPGDDFLALVCRDWEAAAAPAAQAGIRVVSMRFGVILSREGGALARMLPPFRLGLAGKLGNGLQVMSWIAIEDAVGAILHALDRDPLSGPVNTVAPHPVTNAKFTRTLARVLRRPAILPMPAFAARLLFGEMADALLLSSARVEPVRLLASGYRFRYPDLEGALRHVLMAA